MKKLAVLMVVLSAAFASVTFAADKGENMIGNLFLFQKCDASLIPEAEAEDPQYDGSGCPLPGNGPWPAFTENRRWGQMRYNLLGDKFRFSFQGKRLLPETDYTLIYYPDEWPGNGLMCLGANTTNPNGNIQIRGQLEILTGLPAPYDKNFNPVAPSGAAGAKIWLVPSADVKCDASGEIDAETGLPADPSMLLAWNPASYLFEANLIVYQYSQPAADDDDEMDDDADENIDAGMDRIRLREKDKVFASAGGNNGKGKIK